MDLGAIFFQSFARYEIQNYPVKYACNLVLQFRFFGFSSVNTPKHNIFHRLWNTAICCFLQNVNGRRRTPNPPHLCIVSLKRKLTKVFGKFVKILVKYPSMIKFHWIIFCKLLWEMSNEMQKVFNKCNFGLLQVFPGWHLAALNHEVELIANNILDLRFFE